MEINNLFVSNFRNIDTKEINFNNFENVISGNNGWGKTSILEAIFFAINLSSFRSSKKATIKDSTSYVKITLIINSKDKLDVLYNEKMTKVFLNNLPITDYSKLKSFNKVIFFNPYDFNIVLGSMSNKRKMIDYNINQIDSKYYEKLISIKNIQKEKKLLLKNNNSVDDIIDINQRLLVEFEFIYQLRDEYIKKILSIASLSDNITINYEKPSINIRNISSLEFKFKKSKLNLDTDKIKFLINGEDIKYYSSRGEIKKAIFEIFSAQAKFIEEVHEEKPVIMIDDLEAELDKENIKYVLSLFEEYQVIYTQIKEKINE